MTGIWVRIGKLAIGVLSGFALSFLIIWLIHWKTLLETSILIRKTLIETDSLFHFSILLAGLPVFLTLWVFRTYDLNHNAFMQATSLLGSNKRLAIVQLMFLRNNKKVFIKEIDKVTHGLNLEREDLSYLDLRNVNFTDTKLGRIDPEIQQAVTIVAANFHGANLQNANFTRAKAPKVNFEEADLRGAKLDGADLRDAIFKKADLRGIRFSEYAKLDRANFVGADLRGIRFSEYTYMYKADFSRAKYDDTSIFGELFEDPIYQGMVFFNSNYSYNTKRIFTKLYSSEYGQVIIYNSEGTSSCVYVPPPDDQLHMKYATPTKQEFEKNIGEFKKDRETLVNKPLNEKILDKLKFKEVMPQTRNLF